MDPYLSLALLAKAFADPNRLFILERLAQGPCAVEDLALKTNLVLGNLSHHLQILKAASLVKAVRKGRNIIYSLQGPHVVTAYQGLYRLSQALDFQEEKLEDHPSLLPGNKVSRQTALKLVREGRAVLLDVRPRDEFNAGHIRGAVHIPLEELEARLKELPEDKLVVSYCRGPYCQLSQKASQLLEGQGRDSHPLEEGFPEWWAQGLPVDKLDREEDKS